ncbi:MAG TPA: GlmU family protein [Cyclobacteriaceae bacterium]|nr:GlmU family protein [Cyclobacteriaceae bacterium]
MNLILFDNPTIRQNLLPFTFTRPVASIRVGILKIAEKWEKQLNLKASYSTEAYLNKKFVLHHEADNYWINGAVCPNGELIAAIQQLKPGDALSKDNMILAVRTPDDEVPEIITGTITEFTRPFTLIDQVWKIYQNNGVQIREDFTLITKGRTSAPVTDPFTRIYNSDQVFIEEGVEIRAALLNADNGPIYLGKNSFVQEGALIRGPFALCEGSHVNMGAKVRGDTTVGPFSKIGGEVSNSVIFGYSNKAHDGFLGNSVIGEWCNLGADTNTSNLKNNYENIKLWNYAKGGFKDTGLMFCGLMLGDHSRCGINMMFNSGTVVGVSASIFGDGYPRNFIPSFAWGGAAGFTTYQLTKALDTASKAMARRNVTLTEEDREILTTLFNESVQYRVWEKK